MKTILILLLSILILSACATKTTENVEPSKLKRFELTGKVLRVDRGKKTASIEHREIIGYMAAMTMDFPFKDDFVLAELAPGAEIKAELVVDNVNGKFWLEKVVITSPPRPGQNPLPLPDAAPEGKQLVDFQLTNQDNKPVSPKSFEGKTWAITFIYSECPLPNFCIAMSRNFSDLANQIAGDKDIAGELRLLSVSFDPKRDTPAKLRSYGLGYLGRDSVDREFKIWQLATGEDAEVRKLADFFGLRYEVDKNDQTQFIHSLRTAVIDPRGRVVKVFSGSDWKPADLLAEMKRTARK